MRVARTVENWAELMGKKKVDKMAEHSVVTMAASTGKIRADSKAGPLVVKRAA